MLIPTRPSILPRIPNISGLIKNWTLVKNNAQKSWGRKNFTFQASNGANGLYKRNGFLLLTFPKGTTTSYVKFVEMGRNLSTGFRLSEEIRQGLKEGSPIVALESAIISHGMPYPDNIQLALKLQSLVRQQGAIPATVGVINGQLVVGLSDEEIEILGSPSKGSDKKQSIKISRRDFPLALSQKLNGGTTVSGTIIGAVKAGIHIFATGGIGGVHRGAETSFDISADLRELGRNQIAVVSAGVKSILDIGKTLEYLETEGVCVAVLTQKDVDDEDVCSQVKINQNGWKSKQIGNAKFPSFFTAESQFAAPYTLSDELEAAHLINSAINFQLSSGILIAVPIPREHETEGQQIEDAVKVGLEKAGKLGIEGKEMTPFLLSEINHLTSGASLHANKCLVEHNVKVATEIALLLAKLRSKPPEVVGTEDGNQTFISRRESWNNLDSNSETLNADVGENSNPKKFRKEKKRDGRPVVVGGCSMDLIMSVEEPEIVTDGRTHKTKIRTVPGGVARNIAEALAKLGHNPILISPVSDDIFGKELKSQLERINVETSALSVMNNVSTAVYSGILNREGECIFGLGDMSIYDRMDAHFIKEECKDVIRNAGILVLDANLGVDVMTAVMSLCSEYRIPVWFEPTELRKARKILEIPRDVWPAMRYISPNLRELMSLTEVDVDCNGSGNQPLSFGNNNTFTSDLSQLQSLYSRCFSVFPGLELILLTRGKEGIQVASTQRRDNSNGFEWKANVFIHPAPEVSVIRSVSGAGDCLNAGFISGILQGLSLNECSLRGTFCAKKSLEAINNVPQSFFSD